MIMEVAPLSNEIQHMELVPTRSNIDLCWSKSTHLACVNLKKSKEKHNSFDQPTSNMFLSKARAQ